MRGSTRCPLPARERRLARLSSPSSSLNAERWREGVCGMEGGGAEALKNLFNPKVLDKTGSLCSAPEQQLEANLSFELC